MFENTAHTIIPQIVGTMNETTVHLRLCDSFLMVKQVVEHGQFV